MCTVSMCTVTRTSYTAWLGRVCCFCVFSLGLYFVYLFVGPPVSERTYTVSSGTLNSSLSYHTNYWLCFNRCICNSVACINDTVLQGTGQVHTERCVCVRTEQQFVVHSYTGMCLHIGYKAVWCAFLHRHVPSHRLQSSLMWPFRR